MRIRSRARRGLALAAAFSACVYLTWPQSSTGRQDAYLLQLARIERPPASDRVLRPATSLSAEQSFSVPVSLTLVDPDRLYVTNYKRLFLVDLARCTFAPTRAIGAACWNPTGVDYNPEHRLLAIANYNCHEVLICDAENPAQPRVLIRLQHPSMISPESCAFDAQGRRVAVADYDGNGLLVFDLDSQRLLWRADVGLCHGVAFDEAHGAVWATSLRDSNVHRFTTSGEPAGRFGTAGWSAGQFLYPTSLDVDSDGRVLVSDAHTGRIIVLDAHGTQLAAVGVNGPANEWFNMPYTAAWANGDQVLVADTFKNRLLLVNPWEQIIVNAWQPPHTDDGLLREWGQLPKSEIAAVPAGTGYQNYRSGGRVAVPLLSEEATYTPCYGSLRRYAGKKSVISCGAMFGQMYYFLNAANIAKNGRQFLLLGSPTQHEYVLVSESGLPCALSLPLGVWFREGYACHEQGDVALIEVIQSHVEALDRVEAMLQDSQVDRMKKLEGVLGLLIGPGRGTQAEAVGCVFHRPQDKAMIELISSGSVVRGSDAVTAYLGGLKSEAGIPFLQFYVAQSMLRCTR